MLKWSWSQLQQYRETPMHFETTIDLAEELMARDSEIQAVGPVTVTGDLNVDQESVIARVKVAGELTLPSTRSLTPVKLPLSTDFMEVYTRLEAGDEALARFDDQQLIIYWTDDVLDLQPAVADNLLLAIPMQILTPQEAKGGQMPKGKDWEVISQGDYESQKQAEKASAPNPQFAKLQGLFQDDETVNKDSSKK